MVDGAAGPVVGSGCLRGTALGSTNHTSMGVFLLGLAFWAVTVDWRILRRPATLAGCIVAGIAGLLPYVYQPLRSRSDPRLDWGDPETLGRWLDVVIRREAWERAWIESPSRPRSSLAPTTCEVSVWNSFGSGLFSHSSVWRPCGPVDGRYSFCCSLILGNFVAMAMHGSRTDLFFWHRYYIPSYVVAALLAGLGLQVLLPATAALDSHRPALAASPC